MTSTRLLDLFVCGSLLGSLAGCSGSISAPVSVSTAFASAGSIVGLAGSLRRRRHHGGDRSDAVGPRRRNLWAMDNGNHPDGADSAFLTRDGSQLTSVGVQLRSWLQ